MQCKGCPGRNPARSRKYLMRSPTSALSAGQKQIAIVILGTLLSLGCRSGTAQQGTDVTGGSDGKPNGSSSTGTRPQTTGTGLDSSHGGNSQFSPRSSDNDSSPELSSRGGFGGAGVSSNVSSSGGVNASGSRGSIPAATNQGGTSANRDPESLGGTLARASSTSRGGGASSPTSAQAKGGATTGTFSKGGGGATGGSSTKASFGTGGLAAKGGTGASGGTAASGGGDQCNVGKWDCKTKPVPLTLSGNTFSHDPTMIFANGTYYRCWTGDNVPSAKSTNLTSWQNANAVFKNGYAAWVDEWLAGVSGETFNFPWAPDVSFFNGEYHIYSTFSAKFGDNISCITHLTTADIAAGSWTDHGPVICTKGSENYNAIDADLGLDASGAPWLAFGSFWDGIMGMPLNR